MLQLSLLHFSIILFSDCKHIMYIVLYYKFVISEMAKSSYSLQ